LSWPLCQNRSGKSKRPPAMLGAFFVRRISADAWQLRECRFTAQPWAGSTELSPCYMTATDAPAGATLVSFTAGCGRRDRNQPAESHARGITNSDQPQSRQTRMSGEGVIGGWLKVRGLLRYSLTSAGTTETAADWHLGQIIQTPQEVRKDRNSQKEN
jgi:hypothetical protein